MDNQKNLDFTEIKKKLYKLNIKIDKSNSIGLNKKPLIIAEISGNHNGSKKSFLNHIISAAKNGADMIKIQTYEPQDITLKNNDQVFVFNGWTFSSSPSITLFDHPVYDIWLSKCII